MEHPIEDWYGYYEIQPECPMCWAVFAFLIFISVIGVTLGALHGG